MLLRTYGVARLRPFAHLLPRRLPFAIGTYHLDVDVPRSYRRWAGTSRSRRSCGKGGEGGSFQGIHGLEQTTRGPGQTFVRPLRGKADKRVRGSHLLRNSCRTPVLRTPCSWFPRFQLFHVHQTISLNRHSLRFTSLHPRHSFTSPPVARSRIHHDLALSGRIFCAFLSRFVTVSLRQAQLTSTFSHLHPTMVTT